jgi:hypothetical protein
MTTGSFEPLRAPPLPSNLQAYLQHRSSHLNLGFLNGQVEFRAHARMAAHSYQTGTSLLSIMSNSMKLSAN